MKIGDKVFVHGYVDEIRKDTVIIRNKGGYFGTVPDEIIGSITECSKCKHCDKDSPNNYMYCKVWKRETAGNWYCSRGIPDDEAN